MTVERPVYRFNMLDTTTTLNGAEAVKEVYREWTRTAECIFTGGDEKLAVSDVMIVSTSTLYQQFPGAILAATGAPVDPDAIYLVKMATHMIWPYDDRGRLTGEDVWNTTTRSARSSPLIRPMSSPPSNPASCSCHSSSRFRPTTRSLCRLSSADAAPIAAAILARSERLAAQSTISAVVQAE